MGSIYSVDTLDKGMIHIPSRMQDDSRFQNGMQFKTDNCLLLEFFVEYFHTTATAGKVKL
jgi:hypothetical protein